jgi:hypothetical protein
VLEEVLPARREAWTERLLLLALWLCAGPEDVISSERWKTAWSWRTNCWPVVSGELPPMVAIAERSVFAARIGNDRAARGTCQLSRCS